MIIQHIYVKEPPMEYRAAYLARCSVRLSGHVTSSHQFDHLTAQRLMSAGNNCILLLLTMYLEQLLWSMLIKLHNPWNTFSCSFNCLLDISSS